ncbi:MAG: DUF1330 domain-containing protein [Candidatus Binatus sp.]
MKVENAVYPAAEQIEALRNDPSPKPIVMLNLLKFRAKAKYADGRKSELTGAQAYGIYAEGMQKIVERGGGKFLFAGDVKYLTLGESLWDIAALVQYPSAAAFVKIATSPEVAEVGVHRAAGLEGQLLICVSQR